MQTNDRSYSSDHPFAGKLTFPEDTPITVEALLTHYTDIEGAVPLGTLRMLAASCTDETQAQQLKALSDADSYVLVVLPAMRHWSWTHVVCMSVCTSRYVTVVKHNYLHLADILEEFPSSSLQLEQFLKAMPALKPRCAARPLAVRHQAAHDTETRCCQVLLDFMRLGDAWRHDRRGGRHVSSRAGKDSAQRAAAWRVHHVADDAAARADSARHCPTFHLPASCRPLCAPGAHLRRHWHRPVPSVRANVGRSACEGG